MENRKAATGGGDRPIGSSRRHALGLILGAARMLPRAMAASAAPLRLGFSESLITEVNLNDARAAMQIWIERISRDLNVRVELSPRVFDPTEELVGRMRAGLLDAVALNVVEYRQIADILDPNQVITETGGAEQYILLAKRSGGFRRVGDLRGRRLLILQAARMCVATPWLQTLLEEGHFGPYERFFASVTPDTKAVRVVLPVFFGQSDACLTSRRSFETICELNPQVGKELTAIATSPPMVVTLYTFHKNYHGVSRERFARVYSNFLSNPAGRQLATLFQFQGLEPTDAASLAPALSILDAAERARRERDAGGRK